MRTLLGGLLAGLSGVIVFAGVVHGGAIYFAPTSTGMTPVTTTDPLPTRIYIEPMAVTDVVLEFVTRTSGQAGVDSTDMVVNASAGTPSLFDYTVPVGKEFHLEGMSVTMTDAAITATKFGGISALTNGVKIEILNASAAVVLDILDGRTIKNNAEFNYIAATSLSITSGADAVFADAHLGRGLSTVHHFHLDAGYKIRWTIQDNLTGIEELRVMVYGHYDP